MTKHTKTSTVQTKEQHPKKIVDTSSDISQDVVQDQEAARKEVQAQLEAQMNKVAQEAYAAGHAEALIASLAPLRELQTYISGNIESINRYLKEQANMSDEQIQQAIDLHTPDIQSSPSES